MHDVYCRLVHHVMLYHGHFRFLLPMSLIPRPMLPVLRWQIVMTVTKLLNTKEPNAFASAIKLRSLIKTLLCNETRDS